jgi:hypothetical protein
MKETTIFDHINALAREEEQLFAKAGDGRGLEAGEIERLDQIKVELDQCYDLLHQRQGRLDAGQNPDDITVRPAEIVEGYEQ